MIKMSPTVSHLHGYLGSAAMIALPIVTYLSEHQTLSTDNYCIVLARIATIKFAGCGWQGS